MVKLAYKDRIEFWKFQHAAITFSEVAKLCDYIQREKIGPLHPLYEVLFTALAVLYARPFKQRSEVRIPDNVVPQQYWDTHKSLVELRDKVSAHYDPVGPKTIADVSLNKMLVSIRNGKASFGLSFLHPSSRGIDRIKSLAEKLDKKMQFHVQKLWQRCMQGQTVPDGDYEIDTSQGNAPLLKRVNFR